MNHFSSFANSKGSIAVACIFSDFITTIPKINILDDPIKCISNSIINGGCRGFWLSIICPNNIKVYVVSFVMGVTVIQVARDLFNIAMNKKQRISFDIEGCNIIHSYDMHNTLKNNVKTVYLNGMNMESLQNILDANFKDKSSMILKSLENVYKLEELSKIFIHNNIEGLFSIKNITKRDGPVLSINIA